MRTRTERIRCARGPQGLIDLTEDVSAIARSTGVSSGRVTISVAGADACVFLNENETGLRLDLKDAIARAQNVVPPATLGAGSVTIPVIDGDLWLGAWQRVLGLMRTEDSELQATVQVYGR
jgi:thiamine phosphate synthase YjbQ (UPF0047 family)